MSKARDWNCILTDTSQISFRWAMRGTPVFLFVCLFVFSDISRSGAAGSYGRSIFSFFEKLPYCFSQWLHQVYKGSFSSTSSPTFVFCFLIDDSHSNRCEVITHWGFYLQFLMISNVKHLFTCLLAICISSLEKNIYSILLHIFNCTVCFYNIHV